jgi:hypothetical protein
LLLANLNKLLLVMSFEEILLASQVASISFSECLVKIVFAATGMLITFFFLILYTALQPYCTASLSKTQACSLIAQFITLFSGLCLVVESFIKKELKRAGQADTTDQSSVAFTILIFGMNLIITAWPVILVVTSGEFAEKFNSKTLRSFNPFNFMFSNGSESEDTVSDSGQDCNFSSSFVHEQQPMISQDDTQQTHEQDSIEPVREDSASGLWEVVNASRSIGISHYETPSEVGQVHHSNLTSKLLYRPSSSQQRSLNLFPATQASTVQASQPSPDLSAAAELLEDKVLAASATPRVTLSDVVFLPAQSTEADVSSSTAGNASQRL